MAKRATMSDIGKLAGVSQATVSLVLNGVPNARVAEQTRQRVFEAATALGYRKGPAHRVPANRTRVIGLLLDELTTTPFASAFLEGAREEAALQDVVIAAFSTRNDPKLEALALDMLLANQIIGVIYATLVTRPAEPPARLGTIPTVLVNCFDAARHYPSVVPADRMGGREATEALLKAGHRRIAHLAGEDWILASQEREAGYRQALSAWNVPVEDDLIMRGGWTVDGGRALTLRLLARPDLPTALFCFNDRMAIGAYDALRQAGLCIPRDMSVVGFDDEDIAGFLSPPLSTMVLPHDEMARWAVGALLDERLPTAPALRMAIGCPLVSRESIAPPRR